MARGEPGILAYFPDKRDNLCVEYGHAECPGVHGHEGTYLMSYDPRLECRCQAEAYYHFPSSESRRASVVERRVGTREQGTRTSTDPDGPLPSKSEAYSGVHVPRDQREEA